jgi:acyl-CoA synthetase (AMP-forming)/AMP-acid ligase II
LTQPRAVESGPDGGNLAPGAWQRLEALPDPRSPQGRIYPLACLIAIAVCAFTAAGNDRFTAVGQWIKRAGQADLARLQAPWDRIAGRYRAPDEKTIRVVLDRLDPRALTRALLRPGTEVEVAEGETGELAARGPYTIRGYLTAPNRDCEAFTAEGFYRSGDLVRHADTRGR